MSCRARTAALPRALAARCAHAGALQRRERETEARARTVATITGCVNVTAPRCVELTPRTMSGTVSSGEAGQRPGAHHAEPADVSAISSAVSLRTVTE